MERDERKRDCGQHAEGTPGRLAAFWGNQLARIKQRAERNARQTGADSQSNGKFRIVPLSAPSIRRNQLGEMQ